MAFYFILEGRKTGFGAKINMILSLFIIGMTLPGTFVVSPTPEPRQSTCIPVKRGPPDRFKTLQINTMCFLFDLLMSERYRREATVCFPLKSVT